MNRTIMRCSLLGAGLISLSALYACDTEPSRNDAHSTAIGERDERLGNDPREQNTGRGSNPTEEVSPAEPEQPAAPGQPVP